MDLPNNKPFNRKDYDLHDYVAKELAVEFFLNSGLCKLDIPLNQQPEQLKICDFEIRYLTTGRNVRVEVERKVVWKKSGTWQGFKTLDIPFRKKDSKSHLYVMVNYNLDTLAIMKTSDVLSSNTYKKSTKMNNLPLTESEQFFAVELDKIQFWTKVNGYWEKIEVIGYQ